MSFAIIPSRSGLLDFIKMEHGESHVGPDDELIVSKAKDSLFGAGGLFLVRVTNEDGSEDSAVFLAYLTWTGVLEGYIQDANSPFELQRLDSGKMQIIKGNEILVVIKKLSLTLIDNKIVFNTDQ